MNVHRLLYGSLDYLIERIWAELGLVKVYTKKRGDHPDLNDPVCLRKGATIEVSSMLRHRRSWAKCYSCRMFATTFIDHLLPTSGTRSYGMWLLFTLRYDMYVETVPQGTLSLSGKMPCSATVLTPSNCICQGKSSKFNPHAQKVGLNHLLQDEDVVSSEHRSRRILCLFAMLMTVQSSPSKWAGRVVQPKPVAGDNDRFRSGRDVYVRY